MSLIRTAAAVGLALLAATPVAAQAAGDADSARSAAERWLVLVDSAKYQESWAAAAKAFQGAVTVAAWETAARQARAPFGTVAGRTLIGAQHTTNLPGAPPGEYYVIQFRTEFAGREAPAVETVVPMNEDGQWRVSGYFIK